MWYIRFILVLIWALIHIIHSSLDNINSTPSILQLRWHRSRSLTNDSHLPPAWSWSWSVNKLNIQTLISQVQLGSHRLLQIIRDPLQLHFAFASSSNNFISQSIIAFASPCLTIIEGKTLDNWVSLLICAGFEAMNLGIMIDFFQMFGFGEMDLTKN